MKKHIIFAHSAGAQDGPGKGSYDLVAYLRAELGEEFEIHYPILEDPEAPTDEMWQSLLSKAFRERGNDECVLIGHSLGGSSLLKYLSERNSDIKIAGLFLIAAPYWGEEDWNVEEYKLAKNFAEKLPEIPSMQLFHCQDDPIVPFNHAHVYKKALPQAKLHALNGDSHAFTNGLPELVDAIRNLRK
ncbi:MAG: alpha/beta hydrolase [Patescibacteria group bacterium]